MRYIIATSEAAKTAEPSTFFFVNIITTPTSTMTRKNNAIAEINKKRLQYFLPKGPNKEFIYT
jgi:hypothetical protein